MDGPTRWLPVLLVILVAVLLLAGPATGQGGVPLPTEMRVEARETGCPGDRSLCFEVDRDSVEAGTTINATAVNPDANRDEHTVYLDWSGDGDADHRDSPADAAEVRIGPLATGSRTSRTFTLPSDASDLLTIWCDLQGHESSGMWTTLQVTGTEPSGQPPEDGGPSTPGPGVGGIVLGVLVAVAIGRFRRVVTS